VAASFQRPHPALLIDGPLFKEAAYIEDWSIMILAAMEVAGVVRMNLLDVFKRYSSTPGPEGPLKSRVEMWRGGLGLACLLPALSFAGASLSKPCPVSTSRSSNWTGAFNASSSRRKHHDFAHEKLRVR
jgi:hypothetical protein